MLTFDSDTPISLDENTYQREVTDEGEPTFSQSAVSDQPKGIPFAVETTKAINVNGGAKKKFRFAPTYYPKRFTETSENEVERTSKQCGGEDVYIKNSKNPEYHVTGIVLAKNVGIFRKVRDATVPVDVITPLSEQGGFECVIKKGEIGDIVGWDSFEQQWQFDYTLDLVGSGGSVESTGDNQIISEILES